MGVARQVWKWLVDRNSPLERLVKDLEKSDAKIADKDNAYLTSRAYKYLKSQQTAYSQDVINSVEDILGKLNPQTTAYLGSYLKNKRITDGDRGELWNPGGDTPESSARKLAQIKREVGEEQYRRIEEAALSFAKLRYDYIIKEIAESGAFSEAYVKKVMQNANYATFDVIQKLTSDFGAAAVESLTGMPVGAHAQQGTVKGIRNPFLATIINDMKMLSFVNQNNLRMHTVNLLKEYDNTLGFKAAPAERKGAGEFVIRDNADFKTVFVMEGGKKQAYYVNKEIADWLGMGQEEAEWLQNAYNKIPRFDRIYRQAIPLPLETTSGKQFYIPLPKSEVGIKGGFLQLHRTPQLFLQSHRVKGFSA